MPITIKKVSWQNNKEALRTIRDEVFIQEQQVPSQDEWDNLDNCHGTVHYIVALNSKGIGTARTLINESAKTAKIGRVAILKEHRGKGLATTLLKQIIEDLQTSGIQTIELDSQLYICALYQKLGFIKQGGIFFDAGIKHIKMVLKLAQHE